MMDENKKMKLIILKIIIDELRSMK